MATDFENFDRRLAVLARNFGRNAENATVAATSRALGVLVNTTPVRTGLARSNWQVGQLGFTPAQIAPRTTGATVQAGRRRIRSLISSGKVDRVFEITNPVPYVAALNAGSSRQAPAGFVQAAVRAVIDSINRDVARGIFRA